MLTYSLNNILVIIIITVSKFNEYGIVLAVLQMSLRGFNDTT